METAFQAIEVDKATEGIEHRRKQLEMARGTVKLEKAKVEDHLVVGMEYLAA